MQKELLQKLALIYVEANIEKGDSPRRLYELYKEAEAELREADSKDFNDHIMSPDFGF